jgi:hypothetical protein
LKSAAGLRHARAVWIAARTGVAMLHTVAEMAESLPVQGLGTVVADLLGIHGWCGFPRCSIPAESP